MVEKDLDKVMEMLGKSAYEAHVGISQEKEEEYFKKDANQWQELPVSTKNHWRKIANAVLVMINNLDCGDFV